MGACATKPKTLEGQAPAEAAVSTPKVAPRSQGGGSRGEDRRRGGEASGSRQCRGKGRHRRRDHDDGGGEEEGRRGGQEGEAGAAKLTDCPCMRVPTNIIIG
ncbi:hypothetical protein ZEAMMB73_Zm00001d035988 [Zea mays]|uniref:Uncharacterized protein n=1 Tax=Zea mays TaxID=4577 RepID=A0A1D6LK25_MAIZE|nr:hypothetical protein ZEAMMB73_Zm00001d035988 [Zea mays]